MRTLPYPSLRAVEAVVRLKSFSRAAEELGLTQSAISQHVRSVEEWTGRTLLLRGGRRSVPTPDGERLAEAVAEGLGRIGRVIDELQHGAHRATTINLACPPGFAANWLFARLLHFDLAHPEIPVSISTHEGDELPGSGRADLAISYGATVPAGIHADRLFGERVFPVCAPWLVNFGGGLRQPADLAHQTLLVDAQSFRRGTPPSWAFWAQETGVALPEPARTRRFGQANLSLQAAAQGAGVALGREPLVIDALRTGTLVRPLPQIARSRLAYWLVCPERALDQRPARIFREWLLAEASKTGTFDPAAAIHGPAP